MLAAVFLKAKFDNVHLNIRNSIFSFLQNHNSFIEKDIYISIKLKTVNIIRVEKFCTVFRI